ncbi:hypothetical protein N7495_009836 [Penicillium taxi]|uniref:uncharacterized protein n=1 Tax=Penicillium taxi TaxID=168475 RepID=UPI002544EBE2|nr:uncharacterized protein N7495_009836 [Penicillium taxi]KAJ5885326.1 hypothetical protein N7495_009836 [Penicillium taxi]
MQQEARNTETYRRGLSSRKLGNLRNMPVQFVSAGQLKPNKLQITTNEELDQESAIESDEQTSGVKNPEIAKIPGIQEEPEQEEPEQEEPEPEEPEPEEPEPEEPEPEEPEPEEPEPEEPESEEPEPEEPESEEPVPIPELLEMPEPSRVDGDNLFFIDTIGQSVHTGLPDPVVCPHTDSEESSEDEIVFTGRNHPRPTVMETDPGELWNCLEPPASRRVKRPITSEREYSRLEQVETRVKPQARQRQQQRHKWSPDDHDMLADYIANIDHEYSEDTHPDGGIGSFQAPTSQMPYTESSVEETAMNAVLSKMHLDIESNLYSSSEDEDLESDFPEQSDVDDKDIEVETGDLELLQQQEIGYSTSNKSSRNRNPSFPSAAAFADALESDPYYGFDIMDFDRPSLRKKSKGKKSFTIEDLINSDSELELRLQMAWQTDRNKKKGRKKEREELRAQGLLGRNPGNADLNIKYSKGMNLEELITEIRSFLLSPNTSLSLPPMTKNHRKAVHELATLLNLKSKSTGNGATRFTMLIKTVRTPKHSRKTISQVDNLLAGKKLNRRIYGSWGSDALKSAKTTRTKRGASGGGGAFSYADGDVVGGSAPEIGVGNRGRAMLEKMGWSSGTALGAINNKGILLPVTHVVKNSRTGLG